MENKQEKYALEGNESLVRVTPEHFIDSLFKVQRKLFKISILLVFIFLGFAVYTNVNFANTPYEQSNWEDLKQGNAIANVLAIISILFLISTWIIYRKTQSGFNHYKSSPIIWNYDNGNFFILNEHGIIFYDAVPVEKITKTTFEGITWTEDDIKGIVEDAVKNEFSLGSLLPSFKFKTTSNFIEPYIPFLKEHELTVIFCEFSEFSFLIIAVKIDSTKFTLQLPIPANTKFAKEEFIQLEQYFYSFAKIKFQFFYVDQHVQENLSVKN